MDPIAALQLLSTASQVVTQLLPVVSELRSQFGEADQAKLDQTLADIAAGRHTAVNIAIAALVTEPAAAAASTLDQGQQQG